jgi:kynurenine formamidase
MESVWRDLSRPIESGMPAFPGDPAVSVTAHATVAGDGYRVSTLSCGSHTGTHVDAPSHTEPDGRPIDAVSIDRFAFDARLVDCRGRPARSAIGPEALPATDADLLVVRTGWADRWGEPAYRDHPYLSRAAARFCRDQGYDVAVDAFSPDPTPPADPTDDGGEGANGDRDGDEPDGVPAHRTLLGADRLILENLTNLAGLPERFELLAFPLPIADGDGAPVRAVARVDPV